MGDPRIGGPELSIGHRVGLPAATQVQSAAGPLAVVQRPGPPTVAMPENASEDVCARARALFPRTKFTSTMDRKSIGFNLVAGSVAVYLLFLVLAFAFLSGQREPLLPAEQWAATCGGAILIVGVVKRLIDFVSPMGPPLSAADHAMLATNTIAATANLLLGVTATPILIDPVSGATCYVVRWCEWTVLAFLMTFVVEAVSAEDTWDPMSLAMLMGLSAGCGLVFPFCPNKWVWGSVMTVSFLTYFTLFPRIARRRRMYLESVESCSCPSDVVGVVANKVSMLLIMACGVMWTLITAGYCVVAAVAIYQGEDYAKNGRPQWPFLVEVILDVLAKLIYAHFISSAHSYVPLEAERQQVRWVRQAMDLVWSGSEDVIVLSEADTDGTARSLVSKGLDKIVGPDEGRIWAAWRKHRIATIGGRHRLSLDAGSDGTASEASSVSLGPTNLAVNDGLAVPLLQPLQSPMAPPPRATSETLRVPLEELIAYAWLVSSDSCPTFSLSWQPLSKVPSSAFDGEAEADDGAKAGGSNDGDPAKSPAAAGSGAVFEVQVTRSVRTQTWPVPARLAYMILVIRDVTERVRMHEMEKRLVGEIAEKTMLAERIGRKKDEEANRFTRHEVKNCVLAAIAQCEALVEYHVKNAQRFEQQSEAPSLEEGLLDLSSKLQRTLNTVLADAMAKELINGDYLPKYECVDVHALLRDSLPKSSRFQLSVEPSPLPQVKVDPHLLFYVHRNAISNAVKYGSRTGPITTEVEHADGHITVRVINSPGPEHTKLTRLQDTRCVFSRGRRLHMGDCLDQRTTKASSGDGGWIMRQCALALGGDVDITFEENRTVFHICCPADVSGAKEKAEVFQLPDDTICIGIDDSKVQRTIIAKMFAALGCPADHAFVYGETDEHIHNIAAIIKGKLQDHPRSRVFVIGDENLDLSDGCACSTVSCTSAFGELRSQITTEELSRILLVIRSANDSRADVERFVKQAHAVMPKRGFSKHAVIEAVQAMWHARFSRPSAAHVDDTGPRPDSSTLLALDSECGYPHMLQAQQQLRCEVTGVVSKLCQEISTAPHTSWRSIRRALINLKGEMCSLGAVCEENAVAIAEVGARVDELIAHQGEHCPVGFPSAWTGLLMAINQALE